MCRAPGSTALKAKHSRASTKHGFKINAQLVCMPRIWANVQILCTRDGCTELFQFKLLRGFRALRTACHWHCDCLRCCQSTTTSPPGLLKPQLAEAQEQRKDLFLRWTWRGRRDAYSNGLRIPDSDWRRWKAGRQMTQASVSAPPKLVVLGNGPYAGPI